MFLHSEYPKSQATAHLVLPVYTQMFTLLFPTGQNNIHTS